MAPNGYYLQKTNALCYLPYFKNIGYNKTQKYNLPLEAWSRELGHFNGQYKTLTLKWPLFYHNKNFAMFISSKPKKIIQIGQKVKELWMIMWKHEYLYLNPCRILFCIEFFSLIYFSTFEWTYICEILLHNLEIYEFRILVIKITKYYVFLSKIQNKIVVRFFWGWAYNSENIQR